MNIKITIKLTYPEHTKSTFSVTDSIKLLIFSFFKFESKIIKNLYFRKHQYILFK